MGYDMILNGVPYRMYRGGENSGMCHGTPREISHVGVHHNGCLTWQPLEHSVINPM